VRRGILGSPISEAGFGTGGRLYQVSSRAKVQTRRLLGGLTKQRGFRVEGAERIALSISRP
jgi:hypothetical protein